MSTPPQPRGARSTGPTPDDPTRDLRRPSLPAAETVRLTQRSSEDAQGQPDTVASQPTDKLSSPTPVRQQTLAFEAPAGGGPGAAPSGAPLPGFAASPPGAQRPGSAPSRPRPGAGAPSHGSPTVGARPAPTSRRRWPWVVLVVLPIVVIAIAGVLLFLLLGGA
ncbi:MAG: hypothetical protein ACLGI3_05405 [Actinomycetes bacterium]